MCIDMKINKQAQKDKIKAKYELGNFCEQYGLPPIAPSRRTNKTTLPKKSPKNTYIPKNKYYEKPKYNKGKEIQKTKPKTQNDKKDITCFNCGKKGHYKTTCKVKNKINQLEISEDNKLAILEIFKISNLQNSSDSESTHSSSEYHSLNSSNDNDQINFGCNNECCQINVLTSDIPEEELLIDLISKIDNNELKQQYIKKLKNVLINKNKEPKIPKPIINLNETLERFRHINNKKDNIKQPFQIMNDKITILQNENQKFKQEIIQINEKIQLLQLAQSFDDDSSKTDQEILQESSNKNQETLQEQTPLKLNQIYISKWHTKIDLIIGDFKIQLVALIDTGADLNCIQEHIIPTKYYHKTTDQLCSATGSKLKIKYKVPKVIIHQDNTYFETSFVLTQNLTNHVILGIPFISLLYPFITSSTNITASPLGKPITFSFLSAKDSTLQNSSIYS